MKPDALAAKKAREAARMTAAAAREDEARQFRAFYVLL